MSGLNQASGVDYDILDEYKRDGLKVAARTSAFLPEGYTVVEWTRGESVQLVESATCYHAGLIEGLGTKNLVADAVDALHFGNRSSYYDKIGQDNAATGLNDAATLGVQPLGFLLHTEVGNANILVDKGRTSALLMGTAHACKLARCAYLGGETPELKTMIDPKVMVLSCGVFGVIEPKTRVIKPRIQSGDSIILVASTGTAANGLSTARGVADTLEDGYSTLLSDGTPYGEALLAPTPIYVSMVQDLINAGVDIHYCINITGHGFRKLMRAEEPFGYVIENLLPAQPVFGLIQDVTGYDDEKMFASYNMGSGFALIVRRAHTAGALGIIRRHFPATNGGYVVKSGGEKFVDIQPVGVKYGGKDLQIR